MDRNMSHVSVFVSRELRDAIERSAAENDRSLSAEVRVALRAYRLKSSGETSRSGEPVSLDRLGRGLTAAPIRRRFPATCSKIPRATRAVPLLPAYAAGRVLLLGEAGRDRGDDRTKACWCRTGREQPSVRLEEVCWPALVLVAPVGHDRDKVGSGACGEREGAYDAGCNRPDTSHVALAVTRKHRELRVQAHTMTARPAASRWPAGSDTENLEGAA